MPVFVPLALLTALCAVAAYRSKHERLVIFWLLWSGLIHLLLEVSYGFFPEAVQKQAETTFTEYMLTSASVTSWFDPRWWASIYEQYARYDARYALHDPVVVYICWTELVMGPLCFFLVALIARSSRLRHPVQLMLCSMQAYGTFLYFFVPVFDGTWGEVITSDPFELFIFVVMLNGLWIAVPVLLMIQSVRAISRSPALRGNRV